MRIRGRRHCTSCDHRWLYFETGTTTCPDCGSLRNVALDDDPAHQPDTTSDLDLSGVRSMLDDHPLETVAEAARSAAREYVRSRGFLEAGELTRLDGRYVAAAELAYVADHIRRALEVAGPTESRFLALLERVEDGGRPEGIPEPLQSARGFAVAEALETYRLAINRWADGPPPPEISLMDRLRAHGKRIEALDGEVPPSPADALIDAARAVGYYIETGDETSLATAQACLDRLD